MATLVVEVTSEWADITTLASLADGSNYVLGNPSKQTLYTFESASEPSENEVGKSIPYDDERGFAQATDKLWVRINIPNTKGKLTIDALA